MHDRVARLHSALHRMSCNINRVALFRCSGPRACARARATRAHIRRTCPEQWNSATENSLCIDKFELE